MTAAVEAFLDYYVKTGFLECGLTLSAGLEPGTIVIEITDESGEIVVSGVGKLTATP